MSWALVGTRSLFNEDTDGFDVAGNEWQCCNCGCEVYQPGDAQPGKCPFCGERSEDNDTGAV